MKKVIWLFCICTLLSSCATSKQKSLVCESIYEKSSAETVYYYEGQEVESVLIKLRQVFSDEIVASRNRDEILDDLRSAFISTVGAGTQVEVHYDDKTKRADVEMSLNVEDMNERELRYLNLYESSNVKKLIKQLKASGMNCKKVN